MSKPGFNYKKDILDSLKDGGIVTGVTVLGCVTLKALKIKPPFALDPIVILKVTGGICLGSLLKDYMVYKKWIDE